MSKQLGNDIELALSEEETAARVMEAVTDPARRYRDDPGHPEICNVYRLHGYFSPFGQDDLARACRAAKIGCVECKKIMADFLIKAMEPIHAKHQYYESKPNLVEDIIADGSKKARAVALETMEQVRAAIKIK